MTKSVRALLDLFEASAQAFSAVEIVHRFKEKMDKATVYRALERLEDGGTIHSFIDSKGLTWYAKCSGCTDEQHIDRHAHFQCDDCGRMECIAFEASIPNLPDYKINSSTLLLAGQCENCLSNA